MGDTPPDLEGPDRSAKLSELDARIKDARAARTPEPRKREEKWTTVSLAWRMVVELIVAMVVGLAMGYGLDWLFGTLPVFLVIFWLLGFAAGIRLVMQSARELERIQAATAAATDHKP
ncbi:MAG: AtpZ/AtpI family protein [Pseudomonadota bacterium]